MAAFVSQASLQTTEPSPLDIPTPLRPTDAAVDLLINERQVVTREVRGGYYHPSAYLLSKLTLDAMLLRVLPAIFLFLPFYYLANFNTGAPCLLSVSRVVSKLVQAGEPRIVPAANPHMLLLSQPQPLPQVAHMPPASASSSSPSAAWWEP